jgi:nucleotide-binding universal stress UspA family protein
LFHETTEGNKRIGFFEQFFLNTSKKIATEIFMFAPKNILVPVDFSRSSERAFRAAIDIAKKYSADVVYVMHTVNLLPHYAADYRIDVSMIEKMENDSIEKARAAAQKLMDKSPESKDINVVLDIKRGHPYEEIMKAQQEKKIDLIVMGSHSREGVMGYFLGSVASKVSHSAKCPLLIVRE